MLLAADCEGLTRPVVLNGSPLPYWSGESGVNQMRVSGGLLDGAWLVRLTADLRIGRLDGAWLVQNFENLKPENAIWAKYANLFSNVDSEQDRFMGFERGWNFDDIPPQPQVSDREIAEIVRFVRELPVANGVVYREHRM